MYQGITTIDGEQWWVSIASTSLEMFQGLGGLDSIPAGTGMYFDVSYTPQFLDVTTYPMLFPIDIAFISESVVVDIVRNVVPGQIVTSNMAACSFLETNAGEMENVEIGDIVSIETTEAPILQPGFLTFVMPILGLFIVAMVGIALVGAIKGPHHKAIAPPTKALMIPPTTAIAIRGQIAKIVTVPGGSHWKCEICKKELKGGEKAVKLGSKIYCPECARSQAGSYHVDRRAKYYTDTEENVVKSGYMCQTLLDESFIQAIRRVKAFHKSDKGPND